MRRPRRILGRKPLPANQTGQPMHSHIQPVELTKAYRLLNHGPVTLVSSAAAGQRNLMAASWTMPLDFNPPKVALVIDKSTLTRQLIEQSGELVLNVPCRTQAGLTLAVGSASGREHDKFSAHDISTLPASKVGAPLIAGCIGWLECRIVSEPHNQQAYDLFVAEVVAAWADPRVFSNGHWHFDQPERRSIHYVAGGVFFATGEEISVKPETTR